MSYPDSGPEDPSDAESIVRVETGDENSSTSRFEESYSLRFLTTKRMNTHLRNSNTSFLYLEQAIIINEFSDSVIFHILEEILPQIHQYAMPE